MKKKESVSYATCIFSAAAMLLLWFVLTRMAGWSLIAGGMVSAGMAWLLLAADFLIWYLIWGKKLTDSRMKEKEQNGYAECEKLLKAQTISSMPPLLRQTMRQALIQNESMAHKAEQIEQSLRSLFEGSQISFDKYMHTVHEAELLYFSNVRKIAARAALCDKETDQQQIEQAQASIIERMDENRDIFSRFNRLYLEINGLQEKEDAAGPAPILQEIQQLTEQLRFYEQKRG